MKKKQLKICLALMVLISAYAQAQIVEVMVYDDGSKNGYTKVIDTVGTANVLSTSGRSSCKWVQLWENGPKWATFNVGTTITDYINLTVGSDPTPFFDNGTLCVYYNTANVGGLYAWENPNINARKQSWSATVSTGISDVATILWGENWKTPTKNQLDTLQNSNIGKTTWLWCDGNIVQYIPGCTLAGYKVSGVDNYATNSIFLPAACYFGYGTGGIYDASVKGYYWSCMEENSDGIWYMDFDSTFHRVNTCVRELGYSVRAVLVDGSDEKVTITLSAGNIEKINTIICSKGQQISIVAEATLDGSSFTQWSDGNKENPRTIVVTENLNLTAEFAHIQK